jgi:hypothetical protein
MLGLARGLLHMKAGCKGEISYLSEFQSELYERNPHAACIDALSTHRPTIESPFNVDCIGVYGRSLLTLHSIETRCSAPAARRGTDSRAQFPLASTYSPPARPLSRPVARSPMAHSPVRPGAASATHSPTRLQACPLAALPDLSPSRPLADGPLNRPSAPGPLGPLTRPLACRPTRSVRLLARPLSRSLALSSLTASTAVTLSFHGPCHPGALWGLPHLRQTIPLWPRPKPEAPAEIPRLPPLQSYPTRTHLSPPPNLSCPSNPPPWAPPLFPTRPPGGEACRASPVG